MKKPYFVKRVISILLSLLMLLSLNVQIFAYDIDAIDSSTYQDIAPSYEDNSDGKTDAKDANPEKPGEDDMDIKTDEVSVPKKSALFQSLGSEVLVTGYCGGDTSAGYDSNSGAYKNLTWTLYDDGKLTISGTGKMADYAYYSSYVTTAPWGEYRNQLKSLELEDGITSIGEYAFFSCSGLTGNLVIPDSVTSIGNYAFDFCSGFTGDLVIGDSVTSIGSSAFSGCSGFTGNLVIGDSVTSIGASAFSHCFGFTSDLVIPDSVTSIGSFAFSDCSGFTGDLVIGNSVTSIGEWAFYGCFGFTGNLVIGNSVTSIGYYAFDFCSGFTGDLVIPDSVTSIGNYAFSYCSGFTGNLVIPDSVTSIGSFAFSDCSGFTGNLVIPGSVTSIGDYAFSGCSGLTGALVIPDSVKSVGYGAFCDCGGITSITSKSSYFKAQDGILYNSDMTEIVCCPAGKSGNLVIPDSVTSIGNYAFSSCSGFTGNLVIPDSVTSIGSFAFSDCSGFTGNLVIGDSVTSIGDHAFYSCSGFTGNLVIGDSVTSIGDYAFYGCSGLTGDLVIPDSVTSIGDYAFCECSGLASVYFKGDAPDINKNSNAFPLDLTLKYIEGKKGWTRSEWNRYKKTKISLLSVSIETTPFKTVYEVGEKFNSKGLKLRLKYNDGSFEIVDDGYSIEGFQSDIAGTKIITVIYGKFSNTFLVTINEKTVIDENAPQIVIGSGEARIGDTVRLPIILKNSDPLKSIALSNISFDSEHLELIGGEWLSTEGILTNVNIAMKTAVIGFESNTECNGEIFVMTFKVKDGTNDGTYPVSCSVTAKRKDDGIEQNYNIATISGNINVTSIKPGDVNGDDEVNSDDAVYLLYYTLLPELYPINQNCDFDGTLEVNSDDAIYLLYHTLLPELYPFKKAVPASAEPVLFKADDYSLTYEIPKSMYDTVVKDENGYADLTCMYINVLENYKYPLTTWNDFWYGEVVRHLYNPYFIRVLQSEDPIFYVKFYKESGHYMMRLHNFGFLACPEHGGWTDDVARSIEWYGTDSLYHTVSISCPIKQFWMNTTLPIDKRANASNINADSVIWLEIESEHYDGSYVGYENDNGFGPHSILDIWPATGDLGDSGHLYAFDRANWTALVEAIDGNGETLSSYVSGVADKENTYIFNGVPGDFDFGTKVAVNLYDGFGAYAVPLYISDMYCMWLSGLWRSHADVSLDPGMYTFIIYTDNGTFGFSVYLVQDGLEDQFGKTYSRGGPEKAKTETRTVDGTIVFNKFTGVYTPSFFIPKALYDTVKKDENGIADNSAIFLVLSTGDEYPLSQWTEFLPNEVSRHLDADEELSEEYYNGEVGNFVRFYIADGHYCMEFRYFAVVGCPEHGGFTNSTVSQFKWNGTDGKSYALDLTLHVEEAWD